MEAAHQLRSLPNEFELAGKNPSCGDSPVDALLHDFPEPLEPSVDLKGLFSGHKALVLQDEGNQVLLFPLTNRHDLSHRGKSGAPSP